MTLTRTASSTEGNSLKLSPWTQHRVQKQNIVHLYIFTRDKVWHTRRDDTSAYGRCHNLDDVESPAGAAHIAGHCQMDMQPGQQQQ